jgi:DNA-binding NarL/FixJ family response regulator
MTSILIVDDHDGFRREARALLEAEGLVIVGEARTGLEAIEAVHVLAPTVVLLDIGLPDIDGFAVAERLALEGSASQVILTSSRLATTYDVRLAASSATGFIHKDDLSAAALTSLLQHE